MTTTPAIAELDAQHQELRGMMDRCLEVADAVDNGSSAEIELQHEVERLRQAFDAHHRFEDALLRPLLRNARMTGARAAIAENAHRTEHRSFRCRLGMGRAAPPTRDLRVVIAGMRAHLDDEDEERLIARSGDNTAAREPGVQSSINVR